MSSKNRTLFSQLLLAWTFYTDISTNGRYVKATEANPNPLPCGATWEDFPTFTNVPNPGTRPGRKRREPMIKTIKDNQKYMPLRPAVFEHDDKIFASKPPHDNDREIGPSTARGLLTQPKASIFVKQTTKLLAKKTTRNQPRLPMLESSHNDMKLQHVMNTTMGHSKNDMKTDSELRLMGLYKTMNRASNNRTHDSKHLNSYTNNNRLLQKKLYRRSRPLKLAKLSQGVPVNIKSMPWVVSISINWAGSLSSCTGSLIRPNWVITARHCLWSAFSSANPDDVTVYAGTNIQYGDHSLTALKLYEHPRGGRDVALIQLKDNFRFHGDQEVTGGMWASTICLPDNSVGLNSYDDQECYVGAYGFGSEGGLKGARFNFESIQEMNNSWQNPVGWPLESAKNRLLWLNQRMYGYGVVARAGDSGSGVVCKARSQNIPRNPEHWELTGIITNGNSYDFFYGERISTLRGWIYALLDQKSELEVFYILFTYIFYYILFYFILSYPTLSYPSLS